MTTNIVNDHLLVIAIMIKNEAHTITKTLESFLSTNKNYFFVLDTGSTDNTIEVVQEFFKRENVAGQIRQENFIDFATSRNRTLELTKSYFPTANFILMPDAEWEISNINLLHNYCAAERNKTTPLYLIQTYMNSTEFTVARLFRLSSSVQFAGVVHESPTTTTNIKCPENIYFTVNASAKGIEKTRKRWQQDLLLLANTFNNDKQDPRTAFYYAQTYECLGLNEKAYNIYLHRSNLEGFDEENYITEYRLGYLADTLKGSNKKFNWEIAMQHYLQAFRLRPSRIEPLVKIAMHYWPDNIPTCYLFIKHAYDLPYPKNDILFIEKEMYFYDRYEVMSRCAWYLQEYRLGEEATLKALEIHPDMEHLHNNLRLYQEKLSSNEKIPT